MGVRFVGEHRPHCPKPIKKPSPPPPPPKAEPIMYSCTVSVTKTISSKELDDLILVDSFNSMATREVEVADGIPDPGAGLPDPFEYFEKEDMSDMFKRAMLEKMQLVEDPPAKYKCFVCNFHPGKDHHRHGQQVPPPVLCLHLL